MMYTLKNHHKTDENITVKTIIQLQDNLLKLNYQIVGDLSNYHFPQNSKQQRADELWLDSCFELFISHPHKNEYWEINISPSTEWNIYHFTSYKEDMRVSNIISTPTIKSYRYEHEYKLSFETIIQKENFDKLLLINLCVILLDKKGVRNFYSMDRREGSPNFHDRACFKPFKVAS